MRRRLVLIITVAAVAVFACAEPVLAYTTTLTLVGKRTVTLKRSRVPAKVSWDGRDEGNINPTLRYVYKGQTLYRLVGKVDDGDPSTFNKARAEKGYKIRFICRDGYKVSISSKRIVGKKRWIIAKIKAGKLLPDGEAPYRFVGSFVEPFDCHLSARQVYKIRLIF
jgi:hypothetical protein